MWFIFALWAVAATFFALAAAGVWRGRLYFGPANAPIAFSGRPIAFVACCLFYLFVSGLFALVALLLVEYSIPRGSVRPAPSRRQHPSFPRRWVVGPGSPDSEVARLTTRSSEQRLAVGFSLHSTSVLASLRR